MAVDPGQPEEVAQALLRYLADLLPSGAPSFAQPPGALRGGLQSYIYTFALVGVDRATPWARPLVLRLRPAAGPELEREVAAQRFVQERGYSAPAVLAAESGATALGAPFAIMELAPGEPLARALLSLNPLRIMRLARLFADAHVALHRLPSEGWPLPAAGSSVDRQLGRFRDVHLPGEVGEALRWLDERKGTVAGEQLSVCHNNFHPSNVIADGDRLCVIDWANAEVGDRHQDVAATLVTSMRHAYVMRPRAHAVDRLRRRLFAGRYLARYRSQLPIDEERLRYWTAFRAFEYWMVLLTHTPSRAHLQQAAAYFWRTARA